MSQKMTSHQFSDRDGNPDGGCTYGPGFAIAWQRGPLGHGANREEPNGAFVETIIEAVISRLRFYQRSKFECEDNGQAIAHLEIALTRLAARYEHRIARRVEGTNKV